QTQLADVAGDSTQAVLDGLDARALEHRAAVATICAARDGADFDARLRCVDRDGQTIASFIAALAHADAIAAGRARDAVDRLPHPELCTGAMFDAASGPSADDEQAVAELNAAFELGHYGDAIVRADRLLHEDEPHARSVQARAL